MNYSNTMVLLTSNLVNNHLMLKSEDNQNSYEIHVKQKKMTLFNHHNIKVKMVLRLDSRENVKG